ncbi:MAG TPA: hypothetical protein VMM35_02455 [Longimicrobiales bacterium]|nr:hypothetical protein [Longimicrobiales bacterium]
MGPLNAVLRAVFDLVVMPFRGMPAIVGLTIISLVVSVAVLIGFGRLSDQRALAEVKRRIHAGVYEIRLFKDDLPTIFSAQLDIFRETWTYFKLSMVPMLWMIVPIVIVVIQLQFQYGYEPLEPGDSTLLRIELTAEGAERMAATDAADVSLEAPPGVRVETPVVWVPSQREAGWRIAAETPGEYELMVRVGDERLTKSLRVAGSTELRSPVKPSSLWEQIIWPAESPIPRGSQVEAIRVDYVDGEVDMFGWGTHWIIAFFILTMIFAFALQKPLGVKI